MISRAVRVKTNKSVVEGEVAMYFGIQIEVLIHMENYSLVGYRDRKFIVCTSDIQGLASVKCAA